MSLVLRNNVFHFGENYWIKKKGKATGTPLAGFQASIFMGKQQKTNANPKTQTPVCPTLLPG